MHIPGVKLEQVVVNEHLYKYGKITLGELRSPMTPPFKGRVKEKP